MIIIWILLGLIGLVWVGFLLEKRLANRIWGTRPLTECPYYNECAGMFDEAVLNSRPYDMDMAWSEYGKGLCHRGQDLSSCRCFLRDCEKGE